ncbi:MAG TPA: DUF2461 domain-containing protein, partial [Bacteroidota bacterium]|nr:DUF2461 domain-containing protein [Bacteroidota bacterium]
MKLHPPIDQFVVPPFVGFPREGITFLRRLKKNNNRDWFAKHKKEYEEFVKLPMQSLIVMLQGPMMTIAPEFEFNPKRSLFRIYRDTRFSKDKTPYKTHVSAIFHPKGHWEESAGYYLHIEPGEIYLGGGIYMPDGIQLKKIRTAIATRANEFLAIVENKHFKNRFGILEGSKLQRNPQGFRPDHPLIEWLKYKQFYAGVSWKTDQCFSPKFADTVTS